MQNAEKFVVKPFGILSGSYAVDRVGVLLQRANWALAITFSLVFALGVAYAPWPKPTGSIVAIAFVTASLILILKISLLVTQRGSKIKISE